MTRVLIMLAVAFIAFVTAVVIVLLASPRKARP